jgi:hypothetical protein
MMTKDHPRDFSRGTAITIRIGPHVDVRGTDPAAATDDLKRSLQGLLDASIRAYPQHEEGAWWVPASYGGSAPTLAEAARLDAEERRRRAERSSRPGR